MARRSRGARATPTPMPDEFRAGYAPQVQAIAHALRRPVAHCVPDVVERVYPGWKLIGYRVRDGSRSRYFCFVAPLTDGARLGFEHGARLEDQRPLEGSGSQVRYVAVRSIEGINPERVAPLIAEAAALALDGLASEI